MSLSQFLRRAPAAAALAAALAAPALAAQAPAAPAAAQPLPGPRTFTALAAGEEIRVDAQLDEAAWAAATPIDVPYEYFPGDNTPAPVRTDCRITYDRSALYMGCTAHDDNPGRIRANFTDRDAALGDDHVTLLVDPGPRGALPPGRGAGRLDP